MIAYGRVARQCFTKMQVALLDELDLTMFRQTRDDLCFTRPQARSQVPWVEEDYDWPSSWRSSFVAFATSEELVNYLDEKLKGDYTTLQNPLAMPLLHFTIDSSGNDIIYNDNNTIDNSIFCQPSDQQRMVHMIIGHGADVNSDFEGRSTWQCAIGCAFEYHVGNKGS